MRLACPLFLAVVFLIGCSPSEPKSVVVPLDQVPAAFLDTAKKTLPDVKFDHARKLPNGDFEIRGKESSGKVREVELNSKGEVIQIE